MRFESIDISGFRNISSASVSCDAGDIVLTGINGQGKTNFLEAAYILCYGSSFRTSNLKDSVMHGSNGFSLEGHFIDDGIRGCISVSFISGKRRIEIDGKELRDRRDLIYSFPCIVFSHDDISFIRGEAESRRRFFDQMMSLYSPAYFDAHRAYRTILMQRNAAIKSCSSQLASLYDERLALYGLEMMKERAEAVYGFNSIFPELFREISETDMDVRIKYQPSWGAMDSKDDIVSYLARNSERDIIMQTTSSGPHRDRFSVTADDIPFASVGSTGQIRLASILFRIAEAIYFRKMTGKDPILLRDDVLLELDDRRRGRVLSSLPGYSQAFYTFLPRESYFSVEKDDPIYYRVEDGRFTDGRY